MSVKNITIARIYTREGHDVLNQAIKILCDEEHVGGITVLRGVGGIGSSSDLPASSLLDWSLDLPLIIEFYEESLKVEKAIQTLQSRLALEHIVSWPATVHTDSHS
ncbi:MAG: DUF190 domain-containing protein [Gammaproteobacteria bacterium]